MIEETRDLYEPHHFVENYRRDIARRRRQWKAELAERAKRTRPTRRLSAGSRAPRR